MVKPNSNPFFDAYAFATAAQQALPKLDQAAEKLGLKKADMNANSRKFRSSRIGTKTKRSTATKTSGGGGKMRKRRMTRTRRSKKKMRKTKGKKKSPGIVDTEEISGLVNDPDCVYVVHTALDPFQTIQKCVWELMRKLLNRGGFIIHSVDEEFDSNTGFNSTGFTVVVYGKTAETDTEIIRVSHTFASGETIRTLVSATVNPFLEYSSGYTTAAGTGNVNNSIELTKICLYDNKTSNSLQATVDLREEVMTVTGISHLKIQNRTLSGDGTAGTDNVNNNPLQGRVYNFSGVPKPKGRNMSLFDGVTTNRGVQLIRAAVLGLDPNLREPPLPRVFWNCYDSNNCLLNPGDVKQITCKQTKTVNFLKLMKMIRFQNGASPLFKSYYSPFKHQMVAMEDVINVDPEELITLAYEVNRSMYIRSVTKKSNVVSLAGYRQTSYSEITV